MGSVSRWVLPLLLCGFGLTASSARAEDGALSATLSCRPQASPGRVLCEVELDVASGRLPWADALVTAAPPFVRPLRSRVGPRQATLRQVRRIRLPVALVATTSGHGRLQVRARAVVCRESLDGTELCLPATRLLSTTVHVGPIREH